MIAVGTYRIGAQSLEDIVADAQAPSDAFSTERIAPALDSAVFSDSSKMESPSCRWMRRYLLSVLARKNRNLRRLTHAPSRVPLQAITARGNHA